MTQPTRSPSPRVALSALFAWQALLAASLLAAEGVGTANPLTKLTILDRSINRPMPARIHLRDASGKVVKPAGFPAWDDHFVCDGIAEFRLPAGSYAFDVERGPEFSSETARFAVSTTAGTNVTVALERLADLKQEGWWSGDLHVHRGVGDAEMLMQAEDLHIAPIITWWNQVNPWTNRPLPQTLPVKCDGDRLYHPLAGEDERDGGALLYFNLDHPLPITQATRHHPSSLAFANQAKKAADVWIEIEKPFWWDFPMWLAHGVGDSIGIANNHLQRRSMFDNEAWGKPRDRGKYPPAWGNGLWTQDLYYHALNCGFRIPPSAGSASGVLQNPVGYNRVYVHLDGELTWTEWWAGLRAGRCFVSNGPLLRARANGELPGHVFRSRGPLEVSIEARLDSRDPVQAIEWVRNGQVERLALPARLTIEESGWFLLRAVAGVTNTFRFASTAPWYVEIGGRSRWVQSESARFFLEWTRERLAMLERNSELTPEQKQDVLAPWQVARRFWEAKAAEASPPAPPTPK